MRLSELGELGLLAELERRGLARSIGDDAAQLGEGLVVTQDALVERVHFRLDWISWRDLGWGAAFRRQSYVRPPLRLAEGRELAADAHALLDVSDGLAVDAGHIASRSGCRVVVELERVPLASGAELQDLGFGEDYELLAAVSEPSRFKAIGHCEEGEG